MKTFLTSIILGCSVVVLFTGCIGLQIGGGDKHDVQKASLGQQLIDLKHAKDMGVITDAEYQAQKDRLLNEK